MSNLQENNTTELSIRSRYHEVMFSGAKTVRNGDAFLGRLKLDQETATELGTNNVGVFVENCFSLELLVEQMSELGSSNESQWIIVASTRLVAEELQRLWDESVVSQETLNIVITTPEGLKNLGESIDPNSVAAILVVDYGCSIHKARGYQRGRFQMKNDRPQRPP